MQLHIWTCCQFHGLPLYIYPVRIPEIAIKNFHFTLCIVIILVIFGISSFFTMPRSEDPSVTAPGSSIIVIYPGASPADLEQLVVDPLEEAINELEDIKKLTGSAEDGLAVVWVEFEHGSDPDEKYSDVLQKLAAVRHKLPDDILRIDTNKWAISDVNVLQIAIISDEAAHSALRSEAEVLKKELEKSWGVSKAEMWACPEQQVRVSVNLEKMAQVRIPLKQVVGAIQSANMNIPGGEIDVGKKRYTIRTSGAYQSLKDIENTIVHTDGMNITYLKDIADVRFDYEDIKYMARVNGRRAVFVTVQQKEGTNIFDVIDGIKPRIAAFEAKLPASMELFTVFDQSRSVSARLHRFFMNLLQGVALVGFITLLMIGIRASMIVILVIPLSVFIGLGFVDLSGFALEQISIAGLVITLGLLVDNAIVVTENISRFKNMGYGDEEAAVKGAGQIGWAIVSATLTTVFAFIPIIMMKDMSGEFIRSMPVTVIYVLLASLLLALILTPFLSGKLIKARRGGKKGLSQAVLGWFIEKLYRRALGFSLRRRAVVLVIAILAFVGSLTLFPFVGVSFFPKAEKPQLIINIDTPKGTTLEETDKVARFVEEELSSREEIEHFAVNVGHGNPRIYYNIITKRERSTHAQFFVQLKDDDPGTMAKMVGELREKFDAYPSGGIRVKELEQGPVTDAPVAIKVLGDDLDGLRKVAADVEQMVASAPGAVNVDNPVEALKTDMRIKINREKAGMLGIPLVDIDWTVRASIAGVAVSKYRDADGEEYDIVVRLPVDEKPSVEDFDKIYVSSVIGAQIPLNQVASIEYQPGPQKITHYNMDRSVTITADVIGDHSVEEATSHVVAQLEEYDWPRGFRYYVGGERESREESFGGLSRAVVIAMIAIFGVLVFQFRSFSQPLIVFSAIPLAVVGSILALLITGHTFSFTAFIGMTSLVGIVVNNSIILVDYTNQLRGGGAELIDALKEACETRFRPIILTTATTIGGLLPLTLGGGSAWAPMGWTIIGGLAVSTVLTLIIVPILYSLFTPRVAQNG